MRKEAAFIAALVLGTGLFLAGYFFGGKSVQAHLIKENRHFSMLTTVPRYTVSAEIALLLSEKRYERAKCFADASAGVYQRQLQVCLAEEECRVAILEQVKKTAPELLVRDHRQFPPLESLDRCTSPG